MRKALATVGAVVAAGATAFAVSLLLKFVGVTTMSSMIVGVSGLFAGIAVWVWVADRY